MKDDIGELLVEQILESLADVKSPVQGGDYKRTLSELYGAKKKKETGSDKANLDLHGDLINAIDYRVKGNTIQVGVFDSDNAGKADGHNNFSGLSKLPTRQFLPKDGQTFRKDIVDLVNETVDNYRADTAELDSKKLKAIDTKTDLYKLLKAELGIADAEVLKATVLGSRELVRVLDDYDLLDLL